MPRAGRTSVRWSAGYKVGWCFDLLEMDGRDMRPFPLVTRHVRLKALLKRSGSSICRIP